MFLCHHEQLSALHPLPPTCASYIPLNLEQQPRRGTQSFYLEGNECTWTDMFFEDGHL